jgi:hypothetical protein
MSARGASARRFTTVKHWMSVALLVREAAVGDDDDEQQCRLRGARPTSPSQTHPPTLNCEACLLRAAVKTPVLVGSIRYRRSGFDCRKHNDRSVAASFDLNRNVSLVDSHVEAIAQGAKAIHGFE